MTLEFVLENMGMMLFVLILLFIGLWIFTLFKLAKQRSWLWFILIFLFSFVLIIYWIVKIYQGDVIK